MIDHLLSFSSSLGLFSLMSTEMKFAQFCSWFPATLLPTHLLSCSLQEVAVIGSESESAIQTLSIPHLPSFAIVLPSLLVPFVRPNLPYFTL